MMLFGGDGGTRKSKVSSLDRKTEMEYATEHLSFVLVFNQESTVAGKS